MQKRLAKILLFAILASGISLAVLIVSSRYLRI